MRDPFFKTIKETKTWLDRVGVKGYAIRDDLTVDVAGAVDISDKHLTHIPVRFGVVDGHFSCSNNQLTCLIGAPSTCKSMVCADNKLTDLTGVPGQCEWLCCSHNQLTSLVGVPDDCREIYCEDNQLTHLDGIPAGCIAIWCHGNPWLADISAAADGCTVYCDNDAVARSIAERQLSVLEKETTSNSALKPKAGRVL